MKKSWKTTVCGLLALIGPLIAQFFPEYARHGAFLASLGAGLGLLFARDNNVTSEQAGALARTVIDKRQLPLLSMFLLSLFLVACNTSRITIERPDKTKITGFNNRIFWNTEGFALHATATNTFSLELKRSNPDAESMRAIAEGAARGAVKGVAP